MPHSAGLYYSMTKACQDSQDGPGAVLNETIAMVTLSAALTAACSQQWAQSRTDRTIAQFNCSIL